MSEDDAGQGLWAGRALSAEQLAKVAARHEVWLESRGDAGQRADLRGALLNEANLSGLLLSKAILSGVRLRSAKLRGTDLSRAVISGADLGSGLLSRANLEAADVRLGSLLNADLREANLREADLAGADLTGASLRGADLRGTNLSKTRIAGSDRVLAQIDAATYDRSGWDRADLTSWEDAGASLDPDLHQRTRRNARDSATQYEPYPVAEVEELETLTRARARGEGTTKNQQERQKAIDRFVAALKRSPVRDSVVAGCKLVRILGKGNYGVVWEATDVETGDLRAVKIFDSDRLGLGTSLYHFRRGVRAMKHLAQQEGLPSSIVRLHTDEPSGLAISMEMLEEADLTNIAQRGWALEKKLKVFETMCSSVQYAHEHEVIHRDVKPANIVMHHGQPVLTDFDIADLMFAKTRSAAAAGTMTYAAPEALEDGEGHGPTADIYSLGRMLHFLLIEKDPPITFETQPVLKDLAQERVGLVRIIRKCTMRNPHERYQTVAELVRELEKHESKPTEVGVGAPTDPAPAPVEGRPWLTAPRATLLVAFVSGLFLLGNSFLKGEITVPAGASPSSTSKEAEVARLRASLHDMEAPAAQRAAAAARLIELAGGGAADLSGAVLYGADLSSFDLSGADLSAAILQRTDLRGADFTDANLIDASLHGADLSGADFTDANLSGANLRATAVVQEQLDGACGDSATQLPKGRLTIKHCD